MTRKEYDSTGFSMGMGFEVEGGAGCHVLATTNFETGECEDELGARFPLESIARFFYYDGTPVKHRAEAGNREDKPS